MSTGTFAAPTPLADALQRRAGERPDAMACIYLGDGEDTRAELRFGQLDTRGRANAARLQGLGAEGECVILLFPPGLEFLGAFLGCLYGNVVAVPLPVPRVRGSADPIVAIVKELGARILMTTAATRARLDRMGIPELQSMQVLATEDTDAALARAWRPPKTTTADSVAYLQYTSGSTASRKGVVIRHGNVVANLDDIAERFRHDGDSICVNWLPHTHDLGLVGGILQPLYHGHLNVLMSPTAFVQQPMRWLSAISEYRGTYALSPNFGYDVCVRRSTPEQRATLDLRSWKVALNGAEPVRRETVEAFIESFAECGFAREAMFPAYGLAEATLMVSGGPRDRPPVTIELRASDLEQDRVVEAGSGGGVRALVACGRQLQTVRIVIADQATGAPLGDGSIGEIWVSGPAVSSGYWQNEGETALSFRGRLSGGGDETYLRTGDLGFLRNGELFITGRLKDLIIVRGANHYPQDIEWTVERSHPAFRPGCGAAFSLDDNGEEQLVVAVEVEREHLRSLEPEEIARIARRAVAEEHDLHLHTLVLLKTGTVPRTTSGKIQRRKCRADLLAEQLSVIWASTLGATEVRPFAAGASPTAQQFRADALVEWLRDYAGERLNSRLMDERRSIAPHVMLDFGNRGVMGLQVPAEYGGQGFSTREMLQVIEQLGAIDQTLAMMTIVQNSLGVWPILAHGDDALRSEWLPRLATGRELAAFAITEPQAGSNPQAIVSTATADGPGRWRLHGQKSWSGTAGWAGVINVFAQNVDADGVPHGFNGFAVPRGTRGLRMGAEALTLGMRGMVQNTIHLEGAQVTAAQRIGEIGGGMKVAQEAMMQGRLAIGAACVGGIKRCLQLMVRYAGRRTISTGRLVDNPVLLERAGTLSAAVACLEALVARVSARLDEGADVPGDALVICKAAGSEWLWRAADDLVQFLGGRGYIETNVAAQMLRDARVTRILEGPTEALLSYLGSRTLHDGSELHRFVRSDLASPEVSDRLVAAAAEIHGRCTSGQPRFGDGAAALRWAHALVGQLAADAVLLAAAPRGNGHAVRWAERRFETTMARALHEADSGFHLNAGTLASTVSGYGTSIGDVDQSLPGEDDLYDDLLRRDGSAPGAAPRASASGGGVAPAARPTALPVRREVAPPAEIEGAPAPGPRAAKATPRSAVEIEQFIRDRIATSLKVPVRSIDSSRSFFDYGLDSVIVVTLAASLEEWLRLDCNPEELYDVPVIRHYAAHLAERSAALPERSAGAGRPPR